MWSGNTVIDKIDIDHDPVASEYGYVNKQWFEYGTPATNRYSNTTRTQPMQSKGVYSGITDEFDTTDWNTIEEIDITDYDFTETQETKKLMDMTEDEFNENQTKLWS